MFLAAGKIAVKYKAMMKVLDKLTELSASVGYGEHQSAVLH
jgi:hypothetical protein